MNEQKNSVIIQNFIDDPTYVESQKTTATTRSKSSTCVNREELHIERNTVQSHEQQHDPKFHRHSFPNQNFENSLDIPLIDKEATDTLKRSDVYSNGYNQTQLNQDFMIVNEDNQEIQLQRNQNGSTNTVLYTNVNNHFNGGESLYKNNKSLNNIKLAKKMHHLEKNNEDLKDIDHKNSKNNGADNISGQIISGGAHANLKRNNASKKPIIFNSKNGLINTARLYNDHPPTTNSILSKKNLSKSSILHDKSSSNYEKKVVRFADSLGLELESIITLHQSDSGPRRRVIRVNNPQQNHYINPNMMLPKKSLAYTTNGPEKFNFTKVYNAKPSYSNIAQFQIEKNLRRQDHPPRRYLESVNQFEDPNGPCLYDDIINKIAFSSDNSTSNQYRYPSRSFHDYENEMNKNIQSNRIYMSSSDKNINEHLRGQMTNGNNNSNNGHLPYYLLNKGQYSNSSDAINRQQQQQQPRHGNVKNMNSSGSNIPPNITITTRINNGKLESEV